MRPLLVGPADADAGMTGGPSPAQRAELDRYIALLARSAGDLTIESFREATVQRTAMADANVRRLLYWAGGLFMLALVVLFAFPALFQGARFRWVVVWALALGGLGAVSSLLLHILKLTPQQPQQRPEELEAAARIFLGCLFSLVLSLGLLAPEMHAFADYVIAPEVPGDSGPLATGAKAASAAKVQLLFPFLCGYSIPLVLGLLDKLIQAVETTFALNSAGPGPRPRGRRSR